MLRSIALALVLATAAAAQPVPGEAADAYGFVARLGADTVAVERLARTPDGLAVDLVTRVPRTLHTRARLSLDGDGRMTAYEARTADPATGAEVRRETISREGDSLVVHVTTPDGSRAATVALDARALPFVEYAHFPFDVALARGDDGALPMLTERGVLAFEVGRDGASVTLRHPFRGAMTAETDADGRLVALDAGATTRKLLVARTAMTDLAAAARRWAALDAAGQGVGALSGRAEVEAVLDGAHVAIDHGQPALRGRDVWGSVVPWGQVWRTGADRATHLTTDRTLVLGTGADALTLPEGTYTLFSVPAPDGGALIVNRQTGQNGTAYDEAQDLGRVPLALRTLDAPVERLEIAVVPADGAGPSRLTLRWGLAERWVPVAVAD